MARYPVRLPRSLAVTIIISAIDENTLHGSKLLSTLKRIPDRGFFSRELLQIFGRIVVLQLFV